MRAMNSAVIRHLTHLSVIPVLVLAGTVTVRAAGDYAPSSAPAADEGVAVGITPEIGTLGYGADLTARLADTANARFGYHAFDWTIHFNKGDANADRIDGTLDWQTIGALFDWHPFAGGFRTSAGAFFNNNEIRITAPSGATVSINDVDYKIASLDGKVTFNKVSPYIGIGYGNAVGADGRFHLSLDIGVLYHGSPNVSLNATSSNAALQDRMNADLEEEAKDIENKAKSFNVWPVLAIGISYRF